MQKPKVFFLVGPTSVGKTEVAVCLAKRLNAQIISCDSMQVYKGMDIITSKPPFVLRKKVPHHLIDVLAPTREYNVARYRRDAVRKIKEIINKGKVPLFVGGTGLYMSILIDGIFCFEPKSKTIRKRFYKQAETYGSQYLYNRLKKIDPEAAAKIHSNDTRRIVRALEVFESTGRPISFLQKQRKGLTDKYDIRVFCLNMERQKLYKKIEERIDRMFREGLVKEVTRLFRLRLSKTACCAIGIKELKGYFDGLYDLEEAKRMMKRNSRLYARSQLTWFRKDKRINWIEISDKETPKEVADRIYQSVTMLRKIR